MTVSELQKTLGLDILSLPFPDKEINGAYAGDLLSWVMGRAGAGSIWATIMTNANIVAVASLADVAAAVVCENSEIAEQVTETAKTRGVNLLRTEMPMYEFCAALSTLLK